MKKLIVTSMIAFFAPFFVLGQLTGDKNVPSTNYPNFQAVVDSLNTLGVGENGVRFLVAGDQVFSETTLTLTASGTQNGRITIVWDGQGVKPILNFTATAADSEAGIILFGSDFVTLDGLDIRSIDGLLEYGIYLTNASATDGAHFNIVKNVDITLNKENVNQTEAIKVSPSIEITTIDGSTNNNHFYNNSIQNTFIGYSFDGSNSNALLMSVGNEVGTEGEGNSTITDIVMCGVLVDDQNGFRLFNTTIQELTRTGSGTTAPAAISTTSGNPSEPLTNNFEIFNNRIESITSSFTSTYGMYLSARKTTYNVYNNVITGVTATGGGNNTADGIVVLATDVMVNIYNNMVSDIAAPASAVSGNAATRGINIRTFNRAHVFYNTVFLEYTATNAAHSSAAICIYNNNDSVDMRNNIFINLTTLPDNPTGRATAFFKRTPALGNMVQTTDNNIYYAGTPSENTPIFYGHNSTTPAVDVNLSDYQTRAVNFDQNSYTENVPFLNSSDLHISPFATTVARENASVIIAPFAITTDIDGSIRNTENPDIGADEIANPFPAVAIEPNPTNESTIVPMTLEAISWKYISSTEYVDPNIFRVYLSTTPDFIYADPHAVIPFTFGEENYAANIMAGTLLEPLTTYYWKIIPTLSENTMVINPEIPTWSFTTEKYPYPNQVGNMKPAENDSLCFMIAKDELYNFSFTYTPDEQYTLPAAFKVVYGTNNEDFPYIDSLYIPYVEGQIEYNSVYIVDLQLNIFEGSVGFWKVVPMVDIENGPEAPENSVVHFYWTCRPLQVENNPVESMNIYPNPTSGIVNFTLPIKNGAVLQVFSTDGKILISTELETGQQNIDLSSLENGIYFARLSDKSRFILHKITIVK
ncbi:MAG: T9SS type A sorting domain-containing protein [Salinivirgaceae bacterium]|nr:T9SS type A sorting domain-containing protein [Salinivirgaceae bacterium]MDD4747079.1 T9SS type A sorting domain-containing protein [Salinivirgaceae bacterium]MDY0281329.1 T9SS type A sorting domain-containing protein [Salinivirgaceae bacterium]